MARKTAAMKSFFHYLLAAGTLAGDPSAAFTSPKVDKYVPRAITPAEVERLLAQPAKGGDAEALRDRAMLETLYSTGVRVSELVAFDLECVELGTSGCAAPARPGVSASFRSSRRRCGRCATT